MHVFRREVGQSIHIEHGGDDVSIVTVSGTRGRTTGIRVKGLDSKERFQLLNQSDSVDFGETIKVTLVAVAGQDAVLGIEVPSTSKVQRLEVAEAIANIQRKGA